MFIGLRERTLKYTLSTETLNLCKLLPSATHFFDFTLVTQVYTSLVTMDTRSATITTPVEPFNPQCHCTVFWFQWSLVWSYWCALKIEKYKLQLRLPAASWQACASLLSLSGWGVRIENRLLQHVDMCVVSKSCNTQQLLLSYETFTVRQGSGTNSHIIFIVLLI